MHLLMKIGNVKKALEIGVFTGYSSLSIATALPDDGKLFALDISKEYTDVARKYWVEAKVDHKIDCRVGPAVNTLDEMIKSGHEGTFDFAFFDADKDNYERYYEQMLKLVRVGGMIMIDNTLWHGAVIDPDDDSDDTVAIRNLNDKVAKDDRVNPVTLCFADGVTLLVREK
jgi:predicted O-methyltransferase YrrM